MKRWPDWFFSSGAMLSEKRFPIVGPMLADGGKKTKTLKTKAL
jgi:hypothetical protein